MHDEVCFQQKTSSAIRSEINPLSILIQLFLICEHYFKCNAGCVETQRGMVRPGVSSTHLDSCWILIGLEITKPPRVRKSCQAE